jgi:hypothetical protein
MCFGAKVVTVIVALALGVEKKKMPPINKEEKIFN